MQVVDVFTPNRVPSVTFIGDHLEHRTRQLNEALATGAIVISLSGPSKSGKTVFIEKVVGRDRLLGVTGAGVDSPERLWNRVFALIGTSIPKGKSVATASQTTLSGKLSTSVPLTAGVEIAASDARSSSATVQTDQSVDLLQLLIDELRGTDYVVFIDDFHYIATAVQGEIANQIKEAMRQGVTFICASVPYHSDDAVRANPDLRGRIVKLDFDYWKAPELEKIARLGFDALNVAASDAYIHAIAQEAAGSPQLMQNLCMLSCFESGIEGRGADVVQLASDMPAIKRVCARAAASTDYSSTLAKMREGPKARGQSRKAYRLIDGSASDVYPIVLRAIAKDPPELTMRYRNLTRRVHDLCEGEQPSGSSIVTTCEHIASIANEAENRVIVEWDAESEVFDIRDPYLLFYMRWSH